jgi:hypothetical protein
MRVLRVRQHAFSLGLLLALALASPPALGQTAPPPKPRASLSESLSGPAKDAFASAQVLVNNNDFSGAFTKYEQAYKLSKDPRLLFNMAICARGLHAYAKMQALLLRYQRESGPNMPAQDKVDVSGALGVIRTLVGSVKLTVSEPGATVAVDGQAVGTTPLSEPLVIDLGTHTIAIAKPDFDPVERKVQIVGGAEVPLAVTLSARRHVAQLVVSAGDDATVVIDDTVAGKGRFDGQVAAGAHNVQVTEPGKITFKTDVDLQDGETRQVQITLESEKGHGAIWPWVVAGAAAAAGAAVGGYFLFRPQDSQGAALTGVLGSVHLVAWER